MQKKYRKKYQSAQDRTGKALTVLTVLLFLAVAATLGVFLADKVIEPALERQDRLAQVPARSLTVSELNKPGRTAEPALKRTAEPTTDKTLEFEQLSCYFIQSGAYTTTESAQQAAQDVQQEGDAGYLWLDSRTRVLARLYMDETKAQQTAQQWVQQGKDCYVYTCAVGGLSLRVSGEAKQIAALEQAYASWRSALEEITALADQVESGTCTVRAGAKQCGQVGASLEESAQTLGAYAASVQDAGGVLGGLKTLCEQAAQDAQAIEEEGALSQTDFCAQARYLSIRWMSLWRDYIDGIVRRVTLEEKGMTAV